MTDVVLYTGNDGKIVIDAETAKQILALADPMNPAFAGSQPQPTPPADQGDDAAESALATVVAKWQLKMSDEPLTVRILAAIRRGEVPGISAINQSVFDRRQAELYAEVEALRARAEKAEAMMDPYETTWVERYKLAAEVEALRARAEKAEAIAQGPVERGPGYVGGGTWAVHAEQMQEQRDAAIADRNRLLARVAELEGEKK